MSTVYRQNQNLPRPFSLQHHEVLTSTSDVISTKAAAGADAGLIVSADVQTQGRGRYGRKWKTPRGNIAFSLLLRPKTPPQASAVFGLIARRAVANTLCQLTTASLPLTLKWPNDLYLKAKKISGILIESEVIADKVSWLSLGIGVNLDSAPIADSTCLQNIGLSIDAKNFIPAFCHNFLSEMQGAKHEDINLAQAWETQTIHNKRTAAEIRIAPFPHLPRDCYALDD